jgi:geranylgeranyl diphosphate synthase type II
MFGDAGAAAPFAASVEIIHSYSLIHDDLPSMDNDDLRRGRATNHKVFGEGMALLAGDALLNMAYEILFDYILDNPAPNNIKAAKAIAEAAGSLGMAGGQSLDLLGAGNEAAGEKELKYIHAHKTGKLICASLLAGAYAAGADEKYIPLVGEIGEKLGELFQITDDILDIEGDSAQMGKNTGRDDRLDKLTYPRIYGMEKSRFFARQRAEEIAALLGGIDRDTRFFGELALKVLKRSK